MEANLDKADQVDLPRKKNDNPEAEEARIRKKKIHITFFIQPDKVIFINKRPDLLFLILYISFSQ